MRVLATHAERAAAVAADVRAMASVDGAVEILRELAAADP